MALTAQEAPAPTCRLCDSPTPTPDAPTRRPLSVTVEGALEFGRLAPRGTAGGSATVAPDGQGGGTDGGLTDLGGLRYSAEVRLVGEPGTTVRVHWPDRLPMRSADGATVELTDIRSDSPPLILLDAGGRARFGLGARLVVPPGASGAFRGRIPIEAEYE